MNAIASYTGDAPAPPVFAVVHVLAPYGAYSTHDSIMAGPVNMLYVGAARDLCWQLFADGFLPTCGMLYRLAMNPVPGLAHSDWHWRRAEEQAIRRADVVLRAPGVCAWTDALVDYALDYGRNVYYTVPQLLVEAQRRQEAAIDVCLRAVDIHLRRAAQEP